jgi:hypothetical protein
VTLLCTALCVVFFFFLSDRKSVDQDDLDETIIMEARDCIFYEMHAVPRRDASTVQISDERVADRTDSAFIKYLWERRTVVRVDMKIATGACQ